MSRKRDPVERASTADADLYDVSTWEPRSSADRLAIWLYATIRYSLQAIVLTITVLVTVSLLVPPTVLLLDEPLMGVFFALSAIPAGLLALYIWYADITTTEPIGLLIGTFMLTILLATFAAIVNTIGGALLQPIPLVGMILFFYLIVGPVEEAVKLLAVRLLAYRSRSFDAVIDGAVYGAVAGLGFATIENVFYITQVVATAGTEGGLFATATGITTVRALVGPGHVIYSAIAGYYLGLAKFNPDYAGPLVLKGLLVAAFVHGTYNVTVQVGPGLLALSTPLTPDLAFVAYVILFNALIGYYLYRKITRYRQTYRAVRSNADGSDHTPELTEFEPDNRA